MKALAISALLLTLPFSATAKVHSYFCPPQDWEPATLEERKSCVKLAFLGPTENGFAPSVNLAIEEIGEASLKTYLKAARAIHERKPNNHWRQLGKIRTQVGEAELTEIDSETEWGDVRMMQAILIKEKTAYIITAAALKEEFGKYTKDFQKAFQTFSLREDLFEAVEDSEKRESLRKEFLQVQSILRKESPENKQFQKQYWEPLEKKVVSDFKELGTMWQILVLKELLEE